MIGVLNKIFYLENPVLKTNTESHFNKWHIQELDNSRG